jgi:hypothetical protein
MTTEAERLADRIGMHKTEFVINDVWEAAALLRTQAAVRAVEAALPSSPKPPASDVQAQAKGASK